MTSYLSSAVTMALSCTVFEKYCVLEIWVWGHSRSSKLVPVNKLPVVL